MIELVALLVVGFLPLLLFVSTFLRISQEETAATDAMRKLSETVPLQGLRFQNPQVLLESNDYHWQSSNRALRDVAKQHRWDRRRITLRWLRLLQEDLLVLLRVRRLLAGFGAVAGLGAELALSLHLASVFILLQALRTMVWIAGPFVAVALLRACSRQVEAAFRSCGDLLDRVPSFRWPEIQERCSVQFSR